MTGDPREGPATAGQRGLLVAALLVAAALRFTALDQGLRHVPHADEQYFVRNVARMLATGSFDHGFYEYPGLLFYLLAPVLALAGTSGPPGPQAYLAARAFLAALGVASVGLGYLFGARLAGRWAGLLVAGFLAVSPVHVETAHLLRADTALEAFAIAFCLALLRVGERVRGDARAGAALGAALGLKFSAALLAVPYLLRRALQAGPRVRGMLLAGAVAAVVFACVSPYALLRHREFAEGVETQVTYHYQEQPDAPLPYGERLHGWVIVWPKALGPLGAALALAGLALCAPRWRLWLPFVVLPPLTAAVFATTGYRFDRHMLPSLSIVALLAAVALRALARRYRVLAVALALLALAFPLAHSIGYVRAISRPSTRDRAADWLAARLTARARVATTVVNVGLDPGRFEVLRVERRSPLWPLQALEADAVLSLPDDEAALPFRTSLAPDAVLEPANVFEGPRLSLRLVPPGARPPLAPVDLASARLDTSDNPGALEALRDGRLDTHWDVEADAGRASWIEADFAHPVRLARVELLLGDRPRDAGRGLSLLVSDDGLAWRRHPSALARPPTREQLPALGFSEVLVCEPVEARALRVVRQAGARRWSVAELRLWMQPAAP